MRANKRFYRIGTNKRQNFENVASDATARNARLDENGKVVACEAYVQLQVFSTDSFSNDGDVISLEMTPDQAAALINQIAGALTRVLRGRFQEG